ncbi:hypothetical protein TNCT6_41490 [Streptomyces sp. 6-11-2]|nr:hypothetical protein TNCT6_41490 [Streptomyces sp. 6-11-2]
MALCAETSIPSAMPLLRGAVAPPRQCHGAAMVCAYAEWSMTTERGSDEGENFWCLCGSFGSRSYLPCYFDSSISVPVLAGGEHKLNLELLALQDSPPVS